MFKHFGLAYSIVLNDNADISPPAPKTVFDAVSGLMDMAPPTLTTPFPDTLFIVIGQPLILFFLLSLSVY